MVADGPVVTSQNDFTVSLREDRVAKSQPLAQHGLRLRTTMSSRQKHRDVQNTARARIPSTFHFPPPTGVGVTATRRPLPRPGWDAQTWSLSFGPLAVIGGVR